MFFYFPREKKNREEKKWATCLWGFCGPMSDRKKQGTHNTPRAYSDRFIINGTTHEMSISWPNQKAKKTQREKENQALNTLSVSTRA